MQLVKEKEKLHQKSRSWIEINLDNLEHNIKEIRTIVSPNCQIMAVVKANAYGHGMIEIAKKLEELDIKDFAVATLQEGIILRKSGIKSNILILGYTHFTDIPDVSKYNLIQTIVDYEYAYTISKIPLDKAINVHIKINTGMNRIGEDYKNLAKIKEIYHLPNLKVLGIFSHLCVADSQEKDDILFTKEQIKRFDKLIFKLKQSGYNTGKTHLQSSYGLLNYPKLQYDYVRTGIIMYGINSEKNMNTKISLALKPVLSVKARITSIKEINLNETVGYGRKFTAQKRTRIASLSIGYADGYPRNLSEKITKVLINGEYAKVIGRICMDQLMIDITNIGEVKVGDIATLIGNNDEISAEVIANKAGTITNELLSRLGNRLNRVVTTGK